MPREHRITHPTLGPITWASLKQHVTALRITLRRSACWWCFREVPKGARTRCGNVACTSAIEEITMWSTCCSRAMKRSGYKCVLCGKSADEVDHIVPVSLGGTSDTSNLRPLCHACHVGETTRLRREKLSYRARTPYPKHIGARRESVRA